MNRMAFLGIAALIGAAAIRNLDNQGADVLDQPVRKTKAQPREILLNGLRPAAPEKSSSLKRLLKQKVRK